MIFSKSTHLTLLLMSAAMPLQAQWLSLGPFGGSVQLVTVDPYRRDTVLAATANGFLFQSRDAGESWNELPFPVRFRSSIHAVVAGSAHPDTYLVGVSSESSADAGVFRSRDGGENWEQLAGMRGQQVWSLAQSPLDAGVIAAGTESGLFLSHDGGETWRASTPPGDSWLRPIVSIAFDPSHDGVIYVGTPHLAWKRSVDGSWGAIHSGMHDDSDVFSIVVDSRLPDRVLAGACSGIYRSLSSGAAWEKIAVAANVSYRTYFIAQYPWQAGVFYAGTNAGLIRSMNGGASWQKLSSGAVRSIAFDAHVPGRIYLATDDGGVMRSTDAGQHFTEVNRGLCSRHLSRLSARSGSLFTSVVGDSNWRGTAVLPSPTSGWQQTSAPSAIRAVVPSSQSNGVLFALAGEGLFRSAGGRTWTRVFTPAIGRIVAVSGIPGILAAAGPVLMHIDGDGQIIDQMALPEEMDIQDLVPVSSTTIAITSGARVLLWSNDRGWQATSPLPPHVDVFGVAGLPSGGLLAATSAGLMRTETPSGAWRPCGGELAGTTVQAIVADPERENAFFAAVFGIAFESVDGGESWRKLVPEGPDAGRIVQLLPVPGEEGRLLALTDARGVFELRRVSASRMTDPH